MTDQEIHPSLLHSLYTTHRNSVAASVGLALASLGLIGGSMLTRSPAAKAVCFGGTLAICAIATPIRKTARRHEALARDWEDISDSAFQDWLANRLAPAVNLLQLGEALIQEELEFFNLATITAPDDVTCVAIVGASGSGKSFLTTHLIRAYFPDSHIRVFDTDAKPNDWQGLEVVGRKGDTSAIAQAMSEDLALLQSRTQLRGDGKHVGGEEVRVCEEFPTLVADLEPPSTKNKPLNPATEWLKRLVRRGRKYRMKVFLVSQEFQVESLKIGGEGELRKAFTVFYLGGSALEIARKEPDKPRKEALMDWVKQQQRPCIVMHQGRLYPCVIPDLSLGLAATAPVTATIAPVHPEIAELEALYDSSPDYAPAAKTDTTSLLESLPVHLKAIVKFSQKNEWVNARSVQSGVKAVRGYSGTQIRQFFLSLETLGLGSVRGDDDRLEFRAK